MTMEDLNWVQSRLRNCTNARRQLRICAECLCVDEGTLLESLGYASLDAFRAAHPQNKRSCGPPVERICNPVPPEAMLESILYYYGADQQRVQDDGLHPDRDAGGNPAQSMQLEEETPDACRRYAVQAAKTEKGDRSHENDL